MQDQSLSENSADTLPTSKSKPSKKRARIAFAVAVLVGGAILLFATEFAAAEDKAAAEEVSAELK